MEPHSIHEFHVLDGVAPVVVAIVFIIGSSLIKEPNRRNFMAIMIAGAGAAYLSGGALAAAPELWPTRHECNGTCITGYKKRKSPSLTSIPSARKRLTHARC